MSAAKKHAGGRPKKAPGEARPKVMSLRFTEAERAVIDVAAACAKVTPAEWVRAVVIEQLKSIPIQCGGVET
ncbi:MAG: hypothetical protein ACHREM_03135 [Polyangiales bacterium]